MRKYMIIVLCLFVSSISQAQIGGLSASKLSSLTTKTVDYNKLEFEPGFYHSHFSTQWDSEGNQENIFSHTDSFRVVSGMYFRFTYGFWKNMEAGLAISSDLSLAQMGLRYEFLRKSKISMAGIGGINLPMGQKTIDQRIIAENNLIQLGLGLVSTYDFSKNLSLDFTGQYMFFTKETELHNKGGLYLNMDLGYYLFDHQFQIIAASSYQIVNDDEGSHKVFTLNPGVTIETGEKFIIVLSFPFDVYGISARKSKSINFALTLTFD